MKSVRDWFFSQLVSKSLVSSRPLSVSDSFFNEEPLDKDLDDQGATETASLVAMPATRCTLQSSDGNQESQPQPSNHEVVVDYSDQNYHVSNGVKMDPLVKIENIQVKFFRILQRLGLSQDNLLVAKVLYRIHLATLVQAKESDLKRINQSNDRARVVAAEQEAAGLPDLDFSIRILVLGRSGVGKSATINSIFDQTKTTTDAFRPATDCIREVVGTVDGIRINIIDTPGFLPSSSHNVKRNKKIMLSVKRFIRKSPPDVVLYFERLDLISMGCIDFPLLKLITEVFGAAIWFNTILVMTHSSSVLPEGSDGFPVTYDSYVTHCAHLVQHCIHQAVSDSRIENPVILVENHPLCKKNRMGEKILPNGQVWKSQFLLLCICTKVLSDANDLFKLQNSIELGPLATTRLPSQPHLLSSLLRHRAPVNASALDNEIIESLLSDVEEDDEYDQLPPIRILKKTQFESLTKAQKKEYLDELDYRETLYLKKQLKEEYRRQRERRLSEGENLASDGNFDGQQDSPEAVLLPDMAVPLSFDSNCPVHRYRCLLTSDQWLVRPVLDPQGWDHDVGFDGISIETAAEVNTNVFASATGQMSKDKQEFSIQSECVAAYSNPGGTTYSVGLDVQSAGKNLIYTLHADTKLRKLWHNIADCGVSLTSFGNKYYIGAKVEDSISIGKQLKFVANAGRMGGPEQVAYGGSLEAILRGRDYPVKNDNVSLTMTVMSHNKETVLGGSLQSEFQLSRNLRMSVNANLNNRKMGQICIKTSSSEHLQIALIVAFTIFKGLLRRKSTDRSSPEASESR
ncbi:translocase of chloroplast 90, chloroplastic isoform X1 [Ziziphus jujuba]|uniref:Translocase of chloroplast 90, chloroplastic isoform X1 n=1 Tax=Ziziphus jujuba TaxID=326968 RepID=A0A6P6FTZ7_ZIZJJ|nr:translocase of chloroplast 90, chloroplastic isoform X1 [Ziziphus jujuba]XP_024925317.3 translocase of chloroplast 90, chloroplastic isoform X1 [Ziziphus jujuba]XP_024925318.3 translocase of chloroplast 90, chloroplastic isoform X1 [Ziziphus jujuba]XP_048326216.2 translocase of chloroplast 90, chloroplastic isoform X1 [Ziziphus jujuba]